MGCLALCGTACEKTLAVESASGRMERDGGQ